MKKKLIAIVASLAMVATMVPATAFGASVTWSDATDITSKTRARLSMDKGMGPSDYETVSSTDVTKSLTMTSYGTKSKVEGWLPYVEKNADMNTAAGWAGHFADVTFDVPAGDVADATKWAMLRPSVEYDYDARVAGATAEKGPFVDPYTVWRLTKKSYAKTLASGEKVSPTIRLEDYNGIFEAQVLYVTNDWEPQPAGTVANNRAANYVLFANKDAMPAGSNKENLFTMEQLKAVNESQKEEVKAVAEVSIDYSGVILLSKDETADLKYFTDTANGIGSTIDRTYSEKVQTAERAYNRLSDKTKQAIKFSVDKFTVNGEFKEATADNAAKAYNKLETGLENVESYEKLSEVASLIKAIPTWKAEYASDEEIIEKVEAAVKAESKLSGDVKDILENPANGYLTQADLDNYAAAQKGINNKAVADVIAKIDALATLTGDFDSQATVEAIAAPWKEACEAYNDLTEAQQANVTNASKLTSYTKTYKAAVETYVNPIWKEVAEIDVKAGLKAEERAKVAELKSYIDNEYVNTTQMRVDIAIKDFDKKIYNKLVEALNGANATVYDLTNATIDAITDQSYTGKAIKPAITVKDGEGNDIAAENYYVSYDNNLEVGTATVTVVAKSSSDYYGEATATFTITPAALTDAMVKSVANATYTGKAVTPAVTVDKGVTYEVTYSNNTAVGKATATITGTGNYTGTITKNFIVKPAKEAISSLKAGKKSLTVAYKAQTGAKYRIVYSPAKGQAKAVNTTAAKKTIKSLKAGKTYKVKVRAYKTIDGTTYNGTYSTVKKVKVK